MHVYDGEVRGTYAPIGYHIMYDWMMYSRPRFVLNLRHRVYIPTHRDPSPLSNDTWATWCVGSTM